MDAPEDEYDDQVTRVHDQGSKLKTQSAWLEIQGSAIKYLGLKIKTRE